MNEQALVPRYLISKNNSLIQNVGVVVSGVLLLSLLAQVTLRLPYTPVPITGQTFGVAFISLIWGRKRGLAILTGYLSLGALGFPVFAMGHTGFGGATSGYLLGMLFESYVVGYLADKGWSRTFVKSLVATYVGSVCVFTTGMMVLFFYVPVDTIFLVGFYPFLLGDFIKNTLAAGLSSSTNKFFEK